MATGKWQFDSNHLNQTLSIGIELLKDPRLSKDKKSSIRYDIKNIKSYLSKNFEGAEYIGTRPPHEKEKLKKYILRKMEKQYKLLGPDLINWIIDLAETEIFRPDNYSQLALLDQDEQEEKISADSTKLDIEQQAEITIKNYEAHAPEYGAIAKKLILDDEIHQIQIEENILGCSCSRQSEIIGLPFLVINPRYAPWVLNHEIQHGIQQILKYPTNFIYDDLGPIYFELLFNDLLYNQQGYLKSGDYQRRIIDSYEDIYSLSNYFKAMKKFAESNFEVKQDEFEQIFIEQNQISPDFLEEYLLEEVASNEKYEAMNYLFSFLKAIELREKTDNQTINSIELLEPLINTGRFKFSHPKDFTIYDGYVKEIKQKTKQK